MLLNYFPRRVLVVLFASSVTVVSWAQTVLTVGIGQPTDASISTQAYTWRNVRMEGMGYVTGVVKTVPGTRGDVWMSFANGQALYRSTDAGMSFTPVPGLDKVWQFAFGKNKAGKTTPSVYALANIGGQYGLFRSDDLLALPASGAAAAHWTRINGAEGFGSATSLAGDRQTYGRIYVGTSGRGILYGDIAVSEQ